MANQGSVRMTTAQLRAMISGGATRDQLPHKGQAVNLYQVQMNLQMPHI